MRLVIKVESSQGKIILEIRVVEKVNFKDEVLQKM